MNFRNISDIKGTTPHSPLPLNLARVRIPPLTGITVASKINQLPATCPLPNGNPKKLSLIKDCGRNGVLKGVWKCWSKQVGDSKSLSEGVNRHGRSVLSLSFSSSPASAVRAYNNLDTASIITTVYKFVATVSFTVVGHPSIQADYQIMSVSIM